MFEIKAIGSSSSGNCYLLKTENETLILECGMTWKKSLEALDNKITGVVGCLMSHEHKDHAGYIHEFTRRGIDVYSAPGTFIKLGIKSHRTKSIKPLQQFSLGEFQILPFDVQHDAIEPLGFLIQHKEFGKLLFATDTYYIKYKFAGLNYIMIECNYAREIIDENLKNSIVDKAQIKRLLQSHFSLERVKEFLKANDISEVRKIYLIHLSNRNSHAEDFKIQIERLTGIPTEVC